MALRLSEGLGVAIVEQCPAFCLEWVHVHHCVLFVRYATRCLVQCSSGFVVQFGSYPSLCAATFLTLLEDECHQLAPEPLALEAAGDTNFIDEQCEWLVRVYVADSGGHTDDLPLGNGDNQDVRWVGQKGAQKFGLNLVIKDVFVHAVEKRGVGFADQMY